MLLTKRIVISIVSFFSTIAWCIEKVPSTKPRVAIVIIVDQFAYSYLYKLKPYFTGGLRLLLNEGLVYNSAHHPHGLPATAPGFTAFSTGTFAKDHGIVDNVWFDEKGNEVACDDDSAEHAAVFAMDGLYPYGKSAHHIMVDGLSDQCMLSSQPHKKNYAFALAQKSRSAIALASKLGKAVWFDTVGGQFTSSKAYFDELPTWLTTFNKKLGLHTMKSIEWHTRYPLSHPAYHLPNETNYTFAVYKQGLIGRPLLLGSKAGKKEPYKMWLYTPQADKTLLDLATTCIQTYLPETSGTLLVWLGLNTLDLIGHAQGPESRECIDIILQLDKNLQIFFDTVARIVPQAQTLYVLSADHGIDPIPELLNARGIPSKRLKEGSLVNRINTVIEDRHGIKNIIMHFASPRLYLDQTQLSTMEPETKELLLNEIVALVKKEPGVARAWHYDELARSCYQPHQFESWYKNQLYPDRSGDIIYQPLPYYQLTSFAEGTSHITPYESNTHVPLVFYQKDVIKHNAITQRVWALQMPGTLAYLLGMQRPSASTVAILPGITSMKATQPAKPMVTKGKMR